MRKKYSVGIKYTIDILNNLKLAQMFGNKVLVPRCTDNPAFSCFKRGTRQLCQKSSIAHKIC